MDFNCASYTAGNSHINKHTRKERDKHNKEARENREAQFHKLESLFQHSSR